MTETGVVRSAGRSRTTSVRASGFAITSPPGAFRAAPASSAATAPGGSPRAAIRTTT